ncbi:MFS transporter [Micromonospora sp. NBC_01638]|uniref:MFS transporter n=1 Tax=Micromonospora sp. NBC_01638 TaxID=2975982 RepID=UPI003864ABAF|nr:hypothetical protein OG811_29240 [Micromonospora sp. NBC_01638]
MLEVALPAVMVTQLDVSLVWSAGMFVGNTVLVIAVQVPLVVWLGRWHRRSVLAASGVVLAGSYLGFWAAAGVGGDTGAALVAVVCVLYTAGEILYTGSGTALVIASTPERLVGRALVRWQLSTGLGMAVAPAILTGLLAVGPSALWLMLALTTLAGAAVVLRTPTGEGVRPGRRRSARRAGRAEGAAEMLLDGHAVAGHLSLSGRPLLETFS